MHNFTPNGLDEILRLTTLNPIWKKRDSLHARFARIRELKGWGFASLSIWPKSGFIFLQEIRNGQPKYSESITISYNSVSKLPRQCNPNPSLPISDVNAQIWKLKCRQDQNQSIVSNQTYQARQFALFTPNYRFQAISPALPIFKTKCVKSGIFS
jgi:hypothetical protein